jgi:hypothetical protein
MYKALYDFAASSDGEFTFNGGDVFEIVQKEDNGWWLAKKDGKEAWVPSNYLEEVKVAAPPPPPVAPRASIPVPAAKPQPAATPVVAEEAAPKVRLFAYLFFNYSNSMVSLLDYLFKKSNLSPSQNLSQKFLNKDLCPLSPYPLKSLLSLTPLLPFLIQVLMIIFLLGSANYKL